MTSGISGAHDLFWYVLLGAKTILLFAFSLVCTLVMIMLDRKVLARMQVRIGPNRVGPGGWFQSVADGIKLFFKEQITPAAVDKPLYLLAPFISTVTALSAISVIPIGPPVHLWGRTISLQLLDVNVGILVYLALSSLGVYGIVLAGWSSGSKYPLIGGVRASAQLISYEAAAGLALVPAFLISKTLTTSGIVANQGGHFAGGWAFVPKWYVIPLIVPFFIYLIAGIAETNRAPFDLVEAESELVGGFNTEYSGIRFAVFFLAEYVNMVTVSSVATTVFLGGYTGPHPHWLVPLWGVFWYLVKVFGILFVFIWIRGTLPRLRYDQLMTLGWKFLIPLALLYLTGVAFVVAARASDWF
jgi:NADH-quinone oxidoreductase subunit H